MGGNACFSKSNIYAAEFLFGGFIIFGILAML